MSGNLSERDVKGVKWELRPCLFSWLSLNPLCGFLFYVLPVTCNLCGNLGNTSSKPLPWKGPVGLESQRTKLFLVQALGGRGVFTWLPLPDQVVRSGESRQGSGPGERCQGQGHGPQAASCLDKCHMLAAV